MGFFHRGSSNLFSSQISCWARCRAPRVRSPRKKRRCTSTVACVISRRYLAFHTLYCTTANQYSPLQWVRSATSSKHVGSHTICFPPLSHEASALTWASVRSMQGAHSSSSSSSPSSADVKVFSVTTPEVLSAIGAEVVGEGVSTGTGVMPTEALVCPGAGADELPVASAGQAMQVEQSPQARQIWPRPKSVAAREP